MRTARAKIAILEPKHEAAKQKLSYHGDRWYLRDEVSSTKYVGRNHPCYVLRSRDGSKVLFVRKEDDPDFKIRIL